MSNFSFMPALAGFMPPTPPPYPLSEFHLVVSSAALEVQRNLKVPDAMIGLSCLTAMSLSCMGLISVRLPTGQVRPVTLNSLIIADSGERKTATDHILMGPIHEHDDYHAKKHEADMAEYSAQILVWEAIKAGIAGRITQASKKGLPIDALRENLSKHIKAKPNKPRLRRLIREDITGRAILNAIEGDHELIALLSNEGATILQSNAMRQIGLLNSLWDGAPTISIDRAEESILARNALGAVSFMVQEAIFRDYIDKRGDVIRGSGHWARYLIAWPMSTQGYRWVSINDPVWEHLPEFHDRLRKLLNERDRRRESKNFETEVLEFSDDARAQWVKFANLVEADLQPMRYLNDVRDCGSKAVEIGGRVAALMHKFSGQEGKISVDTLNRAWKVVSWHLEEFKRIFSPQAVMPQSQIDAEAVQNYLQAHFWSRGVQVVRKNDVLRNGPVRPSARFEAAVQSLEQNARLHIVTNERRQRYIVFGPRRWGA